MFGEISYLFFSEIQEDFCLKIKVNSILNKVMALRTTDSVATTQLGFPQQWTRKDGWDQIQTTTRVSLSPSDLERGPGVRKV